MDLGNRIGAALACVALMAVACVSTDTRARLVRAVPVDFELDRPGAPVPLFNDNRAPDDLRHFGLKSDRGLPLMTWNGAGPADQFVVGAPPKAWRSVYVTSMGLVYSNFFPSWLPTELYGRQMYYVEDWRAYVWPSSGDSTSRRVEISNGLHFVECFGSTATAGRDYDCPEDPDLVVKNDADLALRVIDADGTEQVFMREGTATIALGGRFALGRVLRKTATGDMTMVKEYIRRPLGPDGIPRPETDKKARISKILQFGPAVSGGSSTDRTTSVTWLGWKDTNQETNDCDPDPTVTPQCPNGRHCYDRKCEDVERATAVEAPADGDVKLARIVTPQRISPRSGVPLVYSIYYLGTWLPQNKYVALVEDNRGPPGTSSFAPRGVSSGNAWQFGYDALLFGRGLKSVSYEQGNDRKAQRFEFTNSGLLQRFWDDRTDPYLFRYTDTAVSSGVAVTMTDPFGLPTVTTLTPIGSRLPTDVPCLMSEGCNVQYGVTNVVHPEGGETTNTYFGATAGASSGEIATATEPDGTTTTFTRDEEHHGRVKKIVKDCQTEEFEYADPALATTPTTTRHSVDDVLLTTESVSLCSSSSTTCPAHDYGMPIRSTTKHENRPLDAVTLAASYEASSVRTVTISDRVSSNVAMVLGDRDPVYGTPKRIQLPGASKQGVATADVVGTPGNPGPACDPTTRNCAGTGDETTSVTNRTDSYWPDDLATSPELSAALSSLALTAPEVGTPSEVLFAAAVGGGAVAASTTRDGAAVEESITKTYDPFNEMPLATAARINGVEISEESTYAQVAFAQKVPTGVGTGERNAPGLVTQRVRKVAGAIASGTYSDFALGTDGTVQEGWRGATSFGSVRSDGSKAAPELTITSDPRSRRQAIVGCPTLRTPTILLPIPCRSDLDCQCGVCSGQTDPFSPGICRNFGPGLPADFVCRQTFLNDSNLTKQRFWQSYTTTHTQPWFLQQCKTPSCIREERLVCDNPR
ncbi:MAG: hypothetical protein U0169_19285 [Polyangiaceae bacterium]